MKNFIQVQRAEMVFNTRKGRFHALREIDLATFGPRHNNTAQATAQLVDSPEEDEGGVASMWNCTWECKPSTLTANDSSGPSHESGQTLTVTGVAINGRAAHPEPDAERHPHHVLRGRRRDLDRGRPVSLLSGAERWTTPVRAMDSGNVNAQGAGARGTVWRERHTSGVPHPGDGRGHGARQA